MQYTDHPDYHQYESIIVEILSEKFDNKIETNPSCYETCPPLLSEKFYKFTHNNLKDHIGRQNNNLKITGFLKPENVNSSTTLFVYQCKCEKYFTGKTNLFNKTHIACEECRAKAQWFIGRFFKQTGLYISNEIAYSIFGLHDGADIPNFIAPQNHKKNRIIPEGCLKLKDQPIEILKELLNHNPDLDKQFFKPCYETNTLTLLTSGGRINNALPKSSDIVDLFLLTNVPHHFKSAAGKRIFRLTVIGIFQNFKPLKAKNISYVCRCDCGYYANVQHEMLKIDSLPSCGRCNSILGILIQNRLQQGETISKKEALELLGYDLSQIPAQVTRLKAIKTNAYEYKKKIYEPETSYSKYSDHFGKTIGLVTLKAKSRRLTDDGIRSPFIGECICGRDCEVPFNHVKSGPRKMFLACSHCASIIQSLIGANMLLGIREDVFFDKWIEFLKFHEIQNLTVNFNTVYKEWILLYQHNPNLFSKQILFEIINKQSATS